MSETTVVHSATGTFELRIAGRRRGFLSYALPDERTMVVEYVEVDPAFQGRRLGEALVSAAVDWARANQRRIVPLCGYARRVISETPAFRDVVGLP